MPRRLSLRDAIRIILSEDSESNVLVLRTPGSDHTNYSASHPKKLKTRRPSLGYEEGEVESLDDQTGPVIVSRAFGTYDR